MPKKNIILLYITEVSGHHSASIAIEKALNAVSAEHNVLNLNAFRYTSPISEKIVDKLYVAIIKRTPKLWDYVYDNPHVKKQLDKLKVVLHKINTPKFRKLFEKVRPDIVICTQAYPCGMVADYKKTYRADFPLVAVLTDYVPHSYWVYDNVDFYITPSDEVTQRLVKKGVPQQKIRALGIPFDPKFSQPVEREAVINKLGLNPFIPTILIMGGGQGLGPIKTIVNSLEKVKGEFQQIIVTGTNKKLFASLKKRSKKLKKKTILLGYASNVNELMAVADLVITKPGGITTSEALAKKLPMLIIKPIPGQEANNTIFLTSQKAAIKVDKPRKVHTIVEDLLCNSQKLQALSEAAGRIAKPNAALDIARFIIDHA